MKRVRGAVFGTGFMGRVHVEALRRLGNVEIVGVAGRTSEGTPAFAAAQAIKNSISDYRELLSNNQIDAVHIFLPIRCSFRWL